MFLHPTLKLYFPFICILLHYKKKSVTIPFYVDLRVVFLDTSSLCLFALKIFEKFIQSKLVSFLHKHILVYRKNRFGFPESLSTAHTLLNIMKKIYNGVYSGCFTSVLFMELSKAFDNGDHDSRFFGRCV